MTSSIFMNAAIKATGLNTSEIQRYLDDIMSDNDIVIETLITLIKQAHMDDLIYEDEPYHERKKRIERIEHEYPESIKSLRKGSK